MTNNTVTDVKDLLSAKTPHDLHVSLAPTDGDGDFSHPRMDVYEVAKLSRHYMYLINFAQNIQIVIGALGNTLSVIRRGMQGKSLSGNVEVNTRQYEKL